MTNIKSICIVRLSALGDVLMLVPLVRTLQDNLPNVRITWVISRPAYDLVEGMDGVEFIVISKPNGFRDYWKFRRQLNKRSFDVLLATQASFRANLLYACIKAKRKIGYDSLRAKDGHRWFVTEQIQPGQDHTLDGFLRFAHSLNLTNPSIRWDLPLNKGDQQWAQQFRTESKLVLINPVASKPERSWMVERYIEVIRYLLSKQQVTIILTGGPGPADRLFADKIMVNFPKDVIDLVGKTVPKQLLALIEAADLMICPDTGPSHMANAVATPVIALHAVTRSNVSGPYNYQLLAIDYYEQAAREVLQQEGDKLPWGTHIHGAESMKCIPTHVVIDRIESVLFE